MTQALAWLCIVAPFVAGLIPAIGSRHDMRMLSMACAATAVAWLVRWTLIRQVAPRTIAATAFPLATAISSVVAIRAGAHAVPGILAVAIVLSAFATAGAVLRHRGVAIDSSADNSTA